MANPVEKQETFFNFLFFNSSRKSLLKSVEVSDSTWLIILFLTEDEKPKCREAYTSEILSSITDSLGFLLGSWLIDHILKCKACAIAIYEIIGVIKEAEYLTE